MQVECRNFRLKCTIIILSNTLIKLDINKKIRDYLVQLTMVPLVEHGYKGPGKPLMV